MAIYKVCFVVVVGLVLKEDSYLKKEKSSFGKISYSFIECSFDTVSENCKWHFGKKESK